MKNQLRRVLAVILCTAILLTVIPFFAVASSYPTLTPGTAATVAVDGNELTSVIFKFVPEKSTVYSFKSEECENYSSSHDTVGRLFDSSMSEIAYNDDNRSSHFLISMALVAGETYYLEASLYNQNSAGEFLVIVEESTSAESMTLNTYNTIYVGEHVPVWAEFSPAGCLQEDFTLSCDDPSVIISYNYFFPTKPGTFTITAVSQNGITASIPVVVEEATELDFDEFLSVTNPDSFDANHFTFTVPEDGIYTISLDDSDGLPLHLSIHYVDSEGVVQNIYNCIDPYGRNYASAVLGKGQTLYIEVNPTFNSDNEFSYSIRVSESQSPTDIFFPKTVYNAVVGYTVEIAAAYLPDFASGGSISYESSDHSILEPYFDNLFTPLSTGTVTVTATSSEGFTASCTVNVTEPREIELKKDNVAYTNPGALSENEFGFTFTPEETGWYRLAIESDYLDMVAIYDHAGNPFIEESVHHRFEGHVELFAHKTYDIVIGTEYTFLYDSFLVDFRQCDEDGNLIHNISNYSFNEEFHFGTCDNCGEYVLRPHVFDENNLCICGFEHIHKYSYTILLNDHEFSCDTCHEYGVEPHNFVDGVCACGLVEHSHSWVYESVDHVEHSAVCRQCLLNVYEPHTFTDGVCSLCGFEDHVHSFSEYMYKNPSNHTALCDICGSIVQAAHEFDSDGNCICGFFLCSHPSMEITAVLDTEHICFCNDCHRTIYEAHAFDADGRCVCGFIDHVHDLSAYEFVDYEAHNVCCSLCSYNYITEDHSYDENGVCVCGHEKISDVILGSVSLADGSYLDRDGNVTSSEPDDWAAHFAGDTLFLDNVTINAPDDNSPAILHDGDLNIIIRGDVAVNSVGNDAIKFPSGSITFSGEGVDPTLTVTVTDNFDGIDACNNGDITIDDISLFIFADDNGIEAEETLTVNSGYVYIVAYDDGIDAEDLEINGGKIVICATDNGIDASDIITVNGGEIHVFSETQNGIEAGDQIYINDGVLFIDSLEFGLVSYYSFVEINGGTLYIYSDLGAVAGYEDILLDPKYGSFATNFDNDFEVYTLWGEELLYETVLDGGNISDIKNKTHIKYGSVSISKISSANMTDFDIFVYDPISDMTLEAGVHYTVEIVETDVAFFVIVEGLGDYIGCHVFYFAKPSPQVIIGTIELEDGDYLANGATSVTKSEPKDTGYAYFSDGVLLLNGFSIEFDSSIYENTSGAIFAKDVEIEIKLDNFITNTGVNGDGLTLDGDISFTGDGLLSVVADYGIYNYSGHTLIHSGNFHIISKECGITSTTASVSIYGGTVLMSGDGGMIYAETNAILCGKIQFVGSPLYTAPLISASEIYVEGQVTVSGALATDADIVVLISGYLVMDTDEEFSTSCLELLSGFLVTNSGIFVQDSLAVYGGCVTATDNVAALSFLSDDTGFLLDDNIIISTPHNSVIVQAVDRVSVFGSDGFAAAKVVISSGIFGDVNADGSVSLADATAYLQYLVGWDVLINESVADVNCDGALNLVDVARILQYIAKWDVTLG